MTERQLEFDFKRAKKLSMIERLTVRCGCAAQGKRFCHCNGRVKSLLKALDSFARDNPTCSVTVAVISGSMGYSPSNTKTVIALARQLNYVDVQSADVAKGTDAGRQRSGSKSTYRINWLKLWNETEEDAGRGPEAAPIEAVETARSGHPPCREVATLPLRSGHLPPREVATLPARSGHVPPEKWPPAPPPSFSSSNTVLNTVVIVSAQETDGDDDENESLRPDAGANQDTTPAVSDVVEIVRSTGVERARSAVEAAQQNGLGLEAIAAIAQHAMDSPGRWPPKVVYHRLTSSDAIDLQPHEGWFGENPRWQRPTPRLPPPVTSTEGEPAQEPSEALKAVLALPLDAVRELIPKVHFSFRKPCLQMLNAGENPARSKNRMVQTALAQALLEHSKTGSPVLL